MLKQLRSLVLTDLQEFTPPGYFDRENESFNVNVSPETKEHVAAEMQWGKLAAELGMDLYFQPPVVLSPRQFSASELLMNMGLLSVAEAMLKVTQQILGLAVASNVSNVNSREVVQHLESSHIPACHENISGAVEQYLQYLTDEEAQLCAPIVSDVLPPVQTPAVPAQSVHESVGMHDVVDVVDVVDISVVDVSVVDDPVIVLDELVAPPVMAKVQHQEPASVVEAVTQPAQPVVDRKNTDNSPMKVLKDNLGMVVFGVVVVVLIVLFFLS